MEVGEHIPAAHEGAYYRNLVEHARVGLILSWARRGQARTPAQKLMHVNEKESDEVVATVTRHGFTFDRPLTRSFRLRAGRDCCEWFKASLLVFIRTSPGAGVGRAELPKRIKRFTTRPAQLILQKVLNTTTWKLDLQRANASAATACAPRSFCGPQTTTPGPPLITLPRARPQYDLAHGRLH
jgi:hypothetical protein